MKECNMFIYGEICYNELLVIVLLRQFMPLKSEFDVVCLKKKYNKICNCLVCISINIMYYYEKSYILAILNSTIVMYLV